MAHAFDTADIAALVAAFPPPSPTRDQPSLVRSLSGNNLKDSRKVLARFRVLLETAPSQIRLSDLPSRLDVTTTEWLFDCYDQPLYHGADGLSLVPKPVLDDVLNDIKTRLQNGVLGMTSLLSEVDISRPSLEALLATTKDGDAVKVFVYQNAGGERYLYSRSYATSIIDSVRSTIADKRSEGIDLSQKYPEVPNVLLKSLADTAMDDLPSEEGRFQTLNGRVVFIPSGYAASQESKHRAAHDRQVQELADRLLEKGYCPISTETDPGNLIVHAVRDRVTEPLKETVCEIVATDNSQTTFLVQAKHLEQAKETITVTTPQETARVWHERDGTQSTLALQDAVVRSLTRHLSSEIALMLLRSTYRTVVDSLITDRFTQLEAEDQDRFSQTLIERLLGPLTLYANGLATVQDGTLCQHLDEYLSTHFRRELIPTILQSLRETRLLLDKARRRDVEKFQATCADAKTLADIHAAATKLSRKQKIPLLDDAALAALQVRVLRQKVKAMKSITRGSDLLQNLLWILLAQQSRVHGAPLFMSAGKDTTRMIKQYQTVAGDTEHGAKLGAWRDMLKAGSERPQDLQEMREMALRCVESLQAESSKGLGLENGTEEVAHVR